MGTSNTITKFRPVTSPFAQPVGGHVATPPSKTLERIPGLQTPASPKKGDRPRTASAKLGIVDAPAKTGTISASTEPAVGLTHGAMSSQVFASVNGDNAEVRNQLVTAFRAMTPMQFFKPEP